MLLFAGLMLVVAIRLWRQASVPNLEHGTPDSFETTDGPACRRDVRGTLLLTSRCAVMLIIVGVLTGVLSGLFGVGGGFVIVPTLVLLSGMSIHRAVGTSLMIVAMVSVSGVASQLGSGRAIPLDITGLFVLGGIIGLLAGQQIGRRLPGPVLQRVFAVIMLIVAAFVIQRKWNL